MNQENISYALFGLRVEGGLFGLRGEGMWVEGSRVE